VWRTLLGNKVYSLINISGLSIGIACCLIIGIYALHELSYDRFFPGAERVYRVVQEQNQAGEPYQVAITPAPLIEALRTNYSEIERISGFSRIFNKRLFQYADKSFEEEGGFHIDSAFFTLFPFSVQEGALRSFFGSADAILLTESTAFRYFGDEDPVGKVIRLDNKQDMVVHAVLDDPPQNSHLKFNFLMPMENLRSHRDFDNWKSNWMYTYVRLKEKSGSRDFETKISSLLSDNISDPDWQPRLYLQALTDIHLHSNFDFNTDIADTGNLGSLYLFAAIGLIIILISCINFVNLTTARSFNRGKEIGIRKVVGASRKQLAFQFIGESLLYAFISTVVATGLAQACIPYFAGITGMSLSLEMLGTTRLLILLFAILLATGILAGIYPALFLSAFNAVRILKGLFVLQRGSGAYHLPLRKILVVFQFTLSVILIVSAVIIRQQMQFVLNRDPGFDKDHILYTPVKGELVDENHYQSFKNALLQHPSVLQITRSNGLPIHHEGSFSGVEWEGMPAGHSDFMMHYFQVDEAFVETFGLKILEGNNVAPRKPGDTTVYYLVNETALEVMGMDDPIGKRLDEGKIVGVVKDFNFQSAFVSIEPMILCSEPENMPGYIAIRMAPGKIAETVGVIERTYKQFNPAYPIEYAFLDERIGALYDQQIRSGKLINFFAALAVLISCLGLFGLSVFTAEQRTKEIGVRKVLGADVLQIMQLLSGPFLKLIAISILIAIPLGYQVIHYWLHEFAYRISIGPHYFILAACVAMLIALLTIGFHTIKTALANPVKSLRNE
jgi:ABC-type antimicrobial peptide transport system permease subunit